MVFRTLVLAAVAALLALSAVVFEAASATALALELVSGAQHNPDTETRVATLRRSAEILQTSWARPIEWHAGTTELLSATYLLDAEARDDPASYERSAFWAARTVSLAPVQPYAWVRLADLQERGYPNSACALQQCLENSWRVAPLIDAETACQRLQIAHRADLLVANDPRIDAYLLSGVQRRDAAACLSFLTPSELFAVLMRSLRPAAASADDDDR